MVEQSPCAGSADEAFKPVSITARTAGNVSNMPDGMRKAKAH